MYQFNAITHSKKIHSLSFWTDKLILKVHMKKLKIKGWLGCADAKPRLTIY